MVAKFAVNFDGASNEERLELWADTVRPFYDFSPLAPDHAEHLTLARGWLLDKLVLVEFKFGAQLVRRDKRRHAAAVPDTLAVQTYRYGEGIGEIAGMTHRVGTDEVNVIDYSRGHQSRWTPAHARSITVAHDLVGYDPSRHPPSMRFGTETAFGYVLHQTINAIFDQVDRTTEVEAPGIASGLVGLLRSLLSSNPEVTRNSPAFAIARKRAIRAHVDEHIAKVPLTADTIARRFNVSRTTLYRDFRQEGGIERFLVGRRLEAALADLAFAAGGRGDVTRIAERMGFASTAHFSRAFRGRFGLAPRDVLGTGRRDGRAAQAMTQAGDQDATLAAFLKRL